MCPKFIRERGSLCSKLAGIGGEEIQSVSRLTAASLALNCTNSYGRQPFAFRGLSACAEFWRAQPVSGVPGGADGAVVFAVAARFVRRSHKHTHGPPPGWRACEGFRCTQAPKRTVSGGGEPSVVGAALWKCLCERGPARKRPLKLANAAPGWRGTVRLMIVRAPALKTARGRCCCCPAATASAARSSTQNSLALEPATDFRPSKSTAHVFICIHYFCTLIITTR